MRPGCGELVGASLRKPVIVAGGARKIGVPGYLEAYRTTGLRGVCGQPQDFHPSGGHIGAIPVEKHQEDLRRRRGRRGRFDRSRGWGRGWRESINQAGDKVVRVVTSAITQIGVRDIQRRPSNGEIAVVEIEGEGRAQVVSDPGYSLITELPAAVVEQLPDARDPQSIEDVRRADTEPDMRRN